MYRRAFLNKPHNNTIASILAEVRYNDTRLIISDCNHTVELDVGTYNSETYLNTLYKIEKIIQVTTEFRDAIVARESKRKR